MGHILNKGLASYNPRAKSRGLPVLYKCSFIGTLPCLFIYIQSMVALTIQGEKLSSLRPFGSQSLTYLLSGGSSQKKFASPHYRGIKLKLTYFLPILSYKLMKNIKIILYSLDYLDYLHT